MGFSRRSPIFPRSRASSASPTGWWISWRGARRWGRGADSSHSPRGGRRRRSGSRFVRRTQARDFAASAAGWPWVWRPSSRGAAAAGPGAVRACTYASAKYPGRAPAGHMLLRAFLAPSDGEPGALAHAELAPLLRITGAPLWTRAFHWPHGLPRYEAHHAARVARVRERLARLAAGQAVRP